MRIDFATFATRGGNLIKVNPHQVRTLVALSNGNTRIEFDKEHSIDVIGDPESVEQALTIDGD